MNKLESKIQKYIDEIAFRIDDNLSQKDEILLLSDIDNLMEIIWYKNLNISIPSNVSDFKNSHYSFELDETIDKNFWNNFYSMAETNRRISNLKNILPSKSFYSSNLNYPEITFKNAILMVKDFFEYYDEDISNHYSSLLKGDNIILFNSDERTFSRANFHLSTQKNSLILINDSLNDISLASAIAHETIHSYSNSFLKGISYEQMCMININNLSEVYSLFIEFAFLKYLKDNNDCDNFKCLKNKLSYNLCDFVFAFNYFLNNLQSINNFNTSETYTYGIILAIHFFEKYQIDSEVTKDNILSMFIDSKDFDKHFLLNNYGIYESNLGDYKTLNKNLLNY